MAAHAATHDFQGCDCGKRGYQLSPAWRAGPANESEVPAVGITSGTIGAWAIWKDYAFVWGILLGAAQILDAAKEFLPQTKNRRNASDFVGIMETIVIDARFEWYSIFTGKFEADEIMDRWRKLARLMTETEGKYFPDGLPANSERQRLAEEEARAYFANIYGVGGGENG